MNEAFEFLLIFCSIHRNNPSIQERYLFCNFSMKEQIIFYNAHIFFWFLSGFRLFLWQKRRFSHSNLYWNGGYSFHKN